MAVHARAEQRSATQSSISHSSRVPIASVAPHSAQLGALQACADASPQVRALAQLRDAQAQLAPSKPAPSRHDGLPAQLKAGVEALSGLSMDHVRVHYGSSKPAQFKAWAYAQGADIHLAPGQEKHLPHEAWHVVQQAQGRVKATAQMKGGVAINDDPALEHEADVMGQKALQAAGMARAPALRALAGGSVQCVAQQTRDNFSARQRAKVLAKNRAKNNGFYTCEHCGFQHKLLNYATYQGRRMGDGGFQVDHILHASRGGRALIGNARVLCGTCNTSRGNRAMPSRFGIDKYRALHKKSFKKDYRRKPSKNR